MIDKNLDYQGVRDKGDLHEYEARDGLWNRSSLLLVCDWLLQHRAGDFLECRWERRVGGVYFTPRSPRENGRRQDDAEQEPGRRACRVQEGTDYGASSDDHAQRGQGRKTERRSEP